MNAFLLRRNFHAGIALSLIVAALIVTACANASGIMLTENTGVVSTLGSASSDPESVFETALIEAGNLARAHGYQYFTVLKSENKSITGTQYVSGETIPAGNSQRTSTRPIGNTNLGTQTSNSTYTTPSAAMHYVRPGYQLTVKMYREGEIDARTDGVWNIDFLPGKLRRDR
jgi:hypothetical protein